ncbi:hypothetical protein [Woeseia oceani]|nr:hypothetical protein [Woeseia oceani]
MIDGFHDDRLENSGPIFKGAKAALLFGNGWQLSTALGSAENRWVLKMF